MKLTKIALFIAIGLGVSTFAQSASIKGKVTAEGSGLAIGGITVTASSENMPKPRTAVTNTDGSYNLPALIPGTYELTFASADGTTRRMSVEVFLDQSTKVNLLLEPVDKKIEVITVTGSSIVREGNSSLTNSIGADVVESVPTGTNYRDLMKLIPGVQYSENSVLGPSAGGSGRDNKYGFDGVDVSLPMFGTLASEPSTHDVQSVTVDRGGAKAIGFNRSGGFSIDTISKSGTNEFHGSLEYKIQNKNLVSEKDDANGESYELDQSWLIGSLSGPIITDQLFFYGSFYQPEENEGNKSNATGPVKDYDSKRKEYFGKLTYAPIDDLLLNFSYRTSDKKNTGESIEPFNADSTSEGSKADQDILTFEGSYIISDYTTLNFQYSEFTLETSGGPDRLLPDVTPVSGADLDLSNLDNLGLFSVPNLQLDNDEFDSAGAQALIDQYGYIGDAGVKTGGGGIGAASTINQNNFYRDSFEISLEHELDLGSTFHNIHVGFKWAEGTETLSRYSNGWGSLEYIGGEETASDGTPIYYRTITQQMSLQDASGATVPEIESSSESYNIEINDSIEYENFIFEVGVLVSKDVLYGQGLRTNSSNVSGYELAPGEKYKMYTVDFKDMIQPRLGATWNYQEDASVFINYARYNPEATSLARAASWARNTRSALDVDFDKDGNYIESEPRDGSSGKFFQDDMTPRSIDEFTIGATKSMSNNLYLRGHVRHRKGDHFWEDTPNTSRLDDYESPFGGVPAHIAEKGLYIENLDAMRDEVGGSSYVIAELDDAFTKYWEVSLEAEYQGDRTYLNVSYVWSHYYGSYDQDNTGEDSDTNLFIGSSNLGDGEGRQVWDGKYGTLNGDKPHVFKAFGYYTTDWEANVGAYFIYQSGDVWEKWDGSVYGYASSTIRYAEHAGSRRESSHWQLDLNYNQNFTFYDDYVVEFKADLFNVFDNQTGYDYDPYASHTTFGEARELISPRRLQLSVKVEF
ncbi:carboxypeptidase regulatory-like domain-containing protein [Colwellia sp. E150_009]